MYILLTSEHLFQGMGNTMGMGNNNMGQSNSGDNHRHLVGGGSAAAYEAARADHYRK